MDLCLQSVLTALIIVIGHTSGADDVTFKKNYFCLYGEEKTKILNGGKEIMVSLDQSTGSGFASIWNYGSGLLQMRIKIPDKDSTATITSFYLKSNTSTHDEIDFEILGSNQKSYVLNTNVYTNGLGGREEKFALWFNPSTDFHIYQVLWNQHQIALFVDNIPIRVYKNKTNIGAGYPTQPMRIEATLWQATWASGGKPVNWSLAPFKAYYEGFGIDGCQWQNPRNLQDCYSSKFKWNGEEYWGLDPKQMSAYESVRKSHLVYDYCKDKGASTYPECKLPSV